MLACTTGAGEKPSTEAGIRENVDAVGAYVTVGAGAAYVTAGACAASTGGAGAAYVPAGAGAMYSTTGAGAAITASAGAMYSNTGAGAAIDTDAEGPRIPENMVGTKNPDDIQHTPTSACSPRVHAVVTLTLMMRRVPECKHCVQLGSPPI